MSSYISSRSLWALTMILFLGLLLPLNGNPSERPLPDPDGRPANMSKPVQVYILLGQSNMLGFGKIKGGNGSLTHATKEKDKYPYLVDDDGGWTVRKDVRNVRVMSSGTGNMSTHGNEWMTITGKNIGPEIGIGHHLGNAIDAPVLILKSCIGNRSLGWDLLPPGSERFEEDGTVYAGYKDSPDKWKKGETPKKIGWYAGMQYDGDIRNAKNVLADLERYYPGAKKYEVAGFFFWQGDKDTRNAIHAKHYEKNLVQLIKTLRKDFDAPKAKFVCATLGQTSKGAGGNAGNVLNAQLAVDGNTGKYREFKGNVASVYSKPHCHGGSSGGHYGGNAETYMDVGLAMGLAMVELIGAENSLSELAKDLDIDSKPVYRALEKKKYSTAWKALKKFKTAHEAKVKDDKLSEEDQAKQKKLLEAFKQEILWPVDQALAEIESFRKSGDIYRLSIAFKAHEKTFKGIDKFDESAEPIAKELKGSAARSAISAGKKFYALIEKVKRAESKRKGARTEKGGKALAAYFSKFAKKEDDNIYGKAAAIAAEKVVDPDHRILAVSSYLKLAK